MRAIVPTRDSDATAKTVGLHIDMVKATAERDFDAAFDAIAAMHADALIVAGDPFFTSRWERIAVLAARARVPAVYDLREYAVAGGLISYGPSLAEGYRQAGRYAGQILKGAKPADLPVMRATRSNWSSTSKRQRLSASKFHHQSSPAPTR
jgi:putative tryptophan/tyrosine transport system substrate-binding protein